jgi:hypothetical protein
MSTALYDMDQDIHDMSVDKEHIMESRNRYRSNTPSRMEFINYKKEFKKTELLGKAKEEAKTLKFKQRVIDEEITPERIIQYKSNEQKPTDNIDKMDFEIVGLDTIAKIPNTLKSVNRFQKLIEKASEADRELLVGIMDDKLFESDQIQYVQRQAP